METRAIIRAARGAGPVDLLLRNVRIVNVFTAEVIPGAIAVSGGFIVGFGSYEAKQTIDMKQRFVAPGFIDPHVHIESAMTCVTEFARAVLTHGTTTVAADPHEIANVLGEKGLTYMLASAANQPMNIYFTLSSCVPATDMETSGARLNAAALRPFLDQERIVALAEVMNYPGVIQAQPEVLAKIAAARKRRKRVDGHAPGLSGKDLFAYITAGVHSDHECSTAREAQEKLRAGMHVMIRQGTGARNLQQLLPVVTEKNCRRLMWCTDDRHPHDLVAEGHIDAIVREAIASGLNPVTAIQMATLNPAQYFGLRHLGAIAPGRQADLVVFSDLNAPRIEQVYCRGKLVAVDGDIRPEIKKPDAISIVPSVNVHPDKIDFSVPARGSRLRVIQIVPDQLITRLQVVPAAISGQSAVADVSRDLLKISVVERHTGSGRVATAFVQGLGLKHGALASSVAHDSHNIIIVGTNDADMQAALATVANMGGGLAAVSGAKTLAALALPIAGLMSPEPVKTVCDRMEHLVRAAHELGSGLKDPFMTLSFLALPVIPELKITDLGLVDVNRFSLVPLFVD